MNVTSIIGWIGVIASTGTAIPQIIKIYKNNSAANGVAFLTYWLLLVVTICYEIRAIAIHEPVFIVSNLLCMATTIWVLILKFKHKHVKEL